MGVNGLEQIFRPERVAVIGSSGAPDSVEGVILKNLVDGGFGGVVFPVVPGREAVHGIPCFPAVSALPTAPDMALVCVPTAEVADAVTACGEAGVLGVVVITGGFAETGDAGRALEEALVAIARRYPGMRLLGPNCMGVVAPHHAMNAAFGPPTPPKGRLAFISQSGALGASLLDWATEHDVGFSHFISLGNGADVGFGDLIDYVAGSYHTDAIILYIESIHDARRWMSAARAFSRTKPIVAFKAGRFPATAAAAASHTGAMVSEDAVYDAAFERTGIVRVNELREVFDIAELLTVGRPSRGSRLAIVTNAGGPGVMAADTLINATGRLAQLSEETIDALAAVLPSSWSHGNPVDILGDADPERYRRTAEIVLADDGVDAMLAILTPQAMTRPTETAEVLADVRAKATKPVLAAFLGGATVHEAHTHLHAARIPSFETPEQAVRAFMAMVAYGRNKALLLETPRDVPVGFEIDRTHLVEPFAAPAGSGLVVLKEVESKALLARYGIPVAETRQARTAGEALARANALEYPVALKIDSPDIAHKTRVGGVALNLHDAHAVRSAFERITSRARAARPDARIHGVTVQTMVPWDGAVELIVGAKHDPTFGAVLMVGLGGLAVEVLRNHVLGFPPLNERLARRMLESLRSWPLLAGDHGQPPIDVDAVVQVLLRLSYLVADHPEVVELDINPILAGPAGSVAVDARVVIDKTWSGPTGRYEHLAIHPYPERYVGAVDSRDGVAVVVRPIRSEDEPRWVDMLGACSEETIRSRFQSAFRWQSHEVASRFCFTDYDREIAIVAEVEEQGEARLVAVGRLVGDPDRDTAEYAILVTDPWQSRGLGGRLTDYCVDVARAHGYRRVVAQTTRDNVRMIRCFRRRGFETIANPYGDVVEFAKLL